MKRTVMFALIAASCLTSACGKDSKKSETKATIIHKDTGTGYCIEVVKEQADAKGLELTDATTGNCPQTTTLQGTETVTRYAVCPATTEEGLPATFVIYNKILNDDGEVTDVTIFSPEAVCKLAVQE